MIKPHIRLKYHSGSAEFGPPKTALSIKISEYECITVWYTWYKELFRTRASMNEAYKVIYAEHLRLTLEGE